MLLYLSQFFSPFSTLYPPNRRVSDLLLTVPITREKNGEWCWVVVALDRKKVWGVLSIDIVSGVRK
jgi:hypothetical protein